MKDLSEFIKDFSFIKNATEIDLTGTCIRNVDIFKNAKSVGFSDKQIAERVKSNELSVRKVRKDFTITRSIKRTSK